MRRITSFGLGLQAVGLLLLAWRALNLPVLSIRAFLLLQLAATGGAVIALLWWLRRRYPPALAAYEWEEKKRAYLPRAAGGAVQRPATTPSVAWSSNFNANAVGTSCRSRATPRCAPPTPRSSRGSRR